MRFKKGSAGFTLLEILIVIVILGVVAGLAIPVFTSNIQKAQAQEAMASLAAIRNALQTYYVMQPAQTYTGASLSPAAAGFIGYDPTATAAGQTLHFTYSLNVVTGSTYTVTASNTAGTAGTVVIDQAGTVTRTGAYA